MNLRKIAVTFLLIFIVATNTAYAESNMIAVGEDKFTIAAGRFLPAFNTKVRVAGEGLGPGDNVDVEDDLGIKRNDSSAYFSASWRFSPKHRIFASFFQSSRQSEVVAEKEIQIGDEVYPAGATLNTKLSFNFAPITYAYTMTKSERSELAVTGGLHWNSIKLRVQGSASTGGQDLDAEGLLQRGLVQRQYAAFRVTRPLRAERHGNSHERGRHDVDQHDGVDRIRVTRRYALAAVVQPQRVVRETQVGQAGRIALVVHEELLLAIGHLQERTLCRRALGIDDVLYVRRVRKCRDDRDDNHDDQQFQQGDTLLPAKAMS